jgi:hypothetical protein
MEKRMGESGDDRLMGRLREVLVGGKPRQSPLYRWLRRHHDELGALLDAAAADGRPPDWAALAGILAEAGLTDGSGNPPTSANTRRTWWRVKRRHAQLHGGGDGPKKAAPPEPQRPAAAGGGEGRSGLDALEAVRREMAQRSGRS